MQIGLEKVQPVFSLTFLSPYGLAWEPSSLQEIPFRKNLLQDAYTAITPPPAPLPPGSQKEFDIWTMELAQAMFFPCYFVFTSLQFHIVVSVHISPSMQKPILLRHLPYTHIYSVFLSPHLLSCFRFILSFVSSFLLPSWLTRIRKKEPFLYLFLLVTLNVSY